MDLERIQVELAKFASERNWDQFHSSKNLSMALAGEAGELLGVFQWLTEEESKKDRLSIEQRTAAAEEIADIMIYAIRLADKLDIDIEKAISSKIEANGRRYTVELAHGNALKR